jgi:hypothetical protein
MKELLKALAEAKKEITPISKDSTNPFFKSKYFDINQLIENVEPILENHGLILLQPIFENKVHSNIYHVDSGESVSSCIELPALTDPQKLGSAITYYRRYTLQSLLSLQTEDDDANDYKYGYDDSLPWIDDTKLKAMIDTIPTNKQAVISKLINYRWSKANKKKMNEALSAK